MSKLIFTFVGQRTYKKSTLGTAYDNPMRVFICSKCKEETIDPLEHARVHGATKIEKVL